MNQALLHTVTIADAQYQIRTDRSAAVVQEAAHLVETASAQLTKQQTTVSQHHALVLAALQYAIAYCELQAERLAKQKIEHETQELLDALLTELDTDESLK
ncbi:MAG: cell division protein ZapA [Candidatus Babeliales bacterium]